MVMSDRATLNSPSQMPRPRSYLGRGALTLMIIAVYSLSLLSIPSSMPIFDKR